MRLLISLSNSNASKRFDDFAMKHALRESNNYKSRSRLVYMDTKTFRDLAAPIRVAHKPSVDKYAAMIKAGDKISDIPLLYIKQTETGTFKVIGHEGRHRSLSLEQAAPGELMPVKITDTIVRWGEDGYKEGDKITLISEDGSKMKHIRI